MTGMYMIATRSEAAQDVKIAMQNGDVGATGSFSVHWVHAWYMDPCLWGRLVLFSNLHGLNLAWACYNC